MHSYTQTTLHTYTHTCTHMHKLHTHTDINYITHIHTHALICTNYIIHIHTHTQTTLHTYTQTKCTLDTCTHRHINVHVDVCTLILTLIKGMMSESFRVTPVIGHSILLARISLSTQSIVTTSPLLERTIKTKIKD